MIMTNRQALLLALACLRKQRQRFAFDANLRKMGINGDRQRLAGAEYDKITEAIKVITGLLQAQPATQKGLLETQKAQTKEDKG